jgi:hypothetical protein
MATWLGSEREMGLETFDPFELALEGTVMIEGIATDNF